MSAIETLVGHYSMRYINIEINSVVSIVFIIIIMIINIHSKQFLPSNGEYRELYMRRILGVTNN